VFFSILQRLGTWFSSTEMMMMRTRMGRWSKQIEHPSSSGSPSPHLLPFDLLFHADYLQKALITNGDVCQLYGEMACVCFFHFRNKLCAT
jgi:hypothetical protein